MIENALGILRTELQSIGIPYAYMQWKPPIQYPYWIGEYSESPTDEEDGSEEYTLMLTGTTKGNWLELSQQRAKIKEHFSHIYGLRKTTDEGAVAFFYENSFPIQTGEADLKRYQINITIKAWKGII